MKLIGQRIILPDCEKQSRFLLENQNQTVIFAIHD